MNKRIVLACVALVACKDATKSDPSAQPAASVTASSAPSSAPSTWSSAGSVAVPADANPLVLAWKVANAPSEQVTVSVVIGDQTSPLGNLHAEADDATGTVATCAMKNAGTTSSRLACGGTPAYNFYTATITGGALVISLTTGIDGDRSTEKVTEVLRRPTTATILKATGPASPAMYGNCRVGYVQKAPDGVCMRQCLKGNECKGKDTCAFITAKGLDGDHRVHACVPPGM